ncbi:hypothetical protein Tco_0175405 [Tanacetum coccineum]
MPREPQKTANTLHAHIGDFTPLEQFCPKWKGKSRKNHRKPRNSSMRLPWFSQSYRGKIATIPLERARGA